MTLQFKVSSKTHELYFSVEREIVQDFGASLSYSWRKYGNYWWSPTYYPDAFFSNLVAAGYHNYTRSQYDYMLAGNIPNQLIDAGRARFTILRKPRANRGTS